MVRGPAGAHGPDGSVAPENLSGRRTRRAATVEVLEPAGELCGKWKEHPVCLTGADVPQMEVPDVGRWPGKPRGHLGL
ncbi:hypothetical protein NDU88_004616 [Pleurodeles waltl]|uniref:Uncharacterized protein n=1 Tax=Pleurodeles waltl TaxID=8319 RepID=A0AAV7W5H3_PLEWA|nr:hypothetical protein NDU88_004616 [Pleurodeles waltl]